MSRGSPIMRLSISLSDNLEGSIPRALKLGLFMARMSEMALSPIIAFKFASLRGYLKISLSTTSAPFCKRNSLAVRQLDQRLHQ